MTPVSDWLFQPGHIPALADCLALGGCAWMGYVTYRMMKARDRAQALAQLAMNALAEATHPAGRNRRPIQAAATVGNSPRIVHVPVVGQQAVDATRTDLRRWTVPTADDLREWSVRSATIPRGDDA